MRPLPVQPTSWQARFRVRAPQLVGGADAPYLVVGVGLATFVFGLLASALLNLYLVATNDPVVQQLRTVLTYKSAILGDGLLLPLVNMAAASFLARQRQHLARGAVLAALLLSAAITAGVHIVQAANDLVNWGMPTPWHWNGIGAWHALYMFAVTSLLVLFFLVVGKVIRRENAIPREAGVVVLGVLVFLVLLRLDYYSGDLQWVPLVR